MIYSLENFIQELSIHAEIAFATILLEKLLEEHHLTDTLKTSVELVKDLWLWQEKDNSIILNYKSLDDLDLFSSYQLYQKYSVALLEESSQDKFLEKFHHIIYPIFLFCMGSIEGNEALIKPNKPNTATADIIECDYSTLEYCVKEAFNISISPNLFQGWISKCLNVLKLISPYKEDDPIGAPINKEYFHSLLTNTNTDQICFISLLPEPLKLLSPSSPYKLPPEITQIEVSEEIKDKGQILTATLFSYYLENDEQIPYKVENIKIQLTSINKSKKLYTFENIEPFMVIWNEKAQHFPKNMKIIINQNNVKVVS